MTVSPARRRATAPAARRPTVKSRAPTALAARHEQYSDFGNTTKPKIAVKYHPTKWLMFRGSFSQSFKAPDLDAFEGPDHHGVATLEAQHLLSY